MHSIPPPLPRCGGVSLIRTHLYTPFSSKKSQKTVKNPISTPLAPYSTVFRPKKETPRQLLTHRLKKLLTWRISLCYNGRGDSLCRVKICRFAENSS